MSRTTREGETKEAKRRAILDMDYTHPTNIPPGVAKEGYVYALIRHKVGNDDDHNFDVRYAQGWEPISIDRVPNRLARRDFFGKNKSEDAYLTFRDVVLVEMEKELDDLKQSRIRNDIREKMNTLKGRGVTNENERIKPFIVSDLSQDRYNQ